MICKDPLEETQKQSKSGFRKFMWGGAREIQRNYRMMGSRDTVSGATKESSKRAGPGAQGTFKRNSLLRLQKDSYILLPYTLCILDLASKTSQDFPRYTFLYIYIHLILIHIFDGKRAISVTLALVVQWALGCTIWAERKPIPFWRFL